MFSLIFKVTFEIDANGTLIVSADDNSTENWEEITITNGESGLSQDEIDRMIGEAEEYNADSIVEEERITAMDSLENDARDLKENAKIKLSNPDMNLSSTENVQKINNVCGQIINWLDNNHQLVDKEEIQACQEMLNSIIGWLRKNKIVDGEQYEERQTRFDSFFNNIFKSSTYKRISKTQIPQPIVPLLDRNMYNATWKYSRNTYYNILEYKTRQKY